MAVMKTIVIVICLLLFSGAASFAAFGIFQVGVPNQSGQNVVDDNSVLVIDDSAVQVVAI